MSLGFGNLWVNDKYVLLLIKIRIFDQVKQSLFSMLHNSSKCCFYKHLVDRVCLQYYLQKIFPEP